MAVRMNIRNRTCWTVRGALAVLPWTFAVMDVAQGAKRARGRYRSGSFGVKGNGNAAMGTRAMGR